MSRKLNFGLLLLVAALVSVSEASAYDIPGWYVPIGGGDHTASNPTPEMCTGCHNIEGTAPVCTNCHSNPFTLTVVANPNTVTVGTPTSVLFTVTRKNSVDAVGGVTVALSGVATGSGTTLPAGTVDINVNANSAGTIIADATRTGYESGTTTVTATEVTPAPVLTTITVSPSTAALSIGDTPVFTATALDQNDLPMEGIIITWTSSEMAVGTVFPENIITGADGTATTTFTAIAIGTAMVNATNGSVSGSADVTVSEEVVTPVLTTITVSPSTAALLIGDTPVFTVTALDQNDLPMEGINITWTSSDMSVGTVSPENVITGANGTATTTFTAIAVGTAIVNATNGSVSGSADVTVSEEVVTPVLTTITVSPSTAALSIGDTPVFTVTALDQNDLPMEGINITWTSSDMSVGTVSPENVITGANGTATTTFTAIAVGTAIVNATNGSVIGSVQVVVTEEIEEINLIKNSCFEFGRQNWIFYTNGKGKFNIISPGFEGNNAAEVKLGMIGSNIQLYQKEVTLKPDTHYRLSFAAKSSRGHDISVSVLKHGSPYTNYGLKQNFDLTKDWQTFTTEFDTKGFAGTVEDGRLMFNFAPFAKAGDKYYFDSVVLEEEME